jgi:hypothetical protein
MATVANKFTRVPQEDIQAWNLAAGDVQNRLRTISNSIFEVIRYEKFQEHTVWCTRSPGGEANFSLNERAPALPNFLRELFQDYSKLEYEPYQWGITEPSERCTERYAWHLSKNYYDLWLIETPEPERKLWQEMIDAGITRLFTSKMGRQGSHYIVNGKFTGSGTTVDYMMRKLLSHCQIYREELKKR